MIGQRAFSYRSPKKSRQVRGDREIAFFVPVNLLFPKKTLLLAFFASIFQNSDAQTYGHQPSYTLLSNNPDAIPELSFSASFYGLDGPAANDNAGFSVMADYLNNKHLYAYLKYSFSVYQNTTSEPNLVVPKVSGLVNPSQATEAEIGFALFFAHKHKVKTEGFEYAKFPGSNGHYTMLEVDVPIHRKISYGLRFAAFIYKSPVHLYPTHHEDKALLLTDSKGAEYQYRNSIVTGFRSYNLSLGLLRRKVKNAQVSVKNRKPRVHSRKDTYLDFVYSPSFYHERIRDPNILISEDNPGQVYSLVTQSRSHTPFAIRGGIQYQHCAVKGVTFGLEGGFRAGILGQALLKSGNGSYVRISLGFVIPVSLSEKPLFIEEK